MMTLEHRLDQVATLKETLLRNREALIKAAIQDCAFTYRESAIEVDTVQDRLAGFPQMAETFAPRRPLAGPGQEVALILPYNGSAWLNTAIVSIYLVGNRVRVKFASRGSDIAHLTEKLYRPIFGDDIVFDYSNGKDFMQRVFEDPAIAAVCMFGSDRHALMYEEAARSHRKKFVFEGPGKDPFMVLEDADLEAAAQELAFAKYIYAGQTCTAPERIYVHEGVYDDFVDLFVDLSRKVRRGDLADPATEMGPVISQEARRAIKSQLKDAVDKGARILLGGDIKGNFVPPTVVVDVTQDMQGMQDETFGPVAFLAKFSTTEEVIRLARDNRYGLRATIYGQAEAETVYQALIGEPYCHPVESMRFGVFGTISVNQPRSESWVGAFVSKPVGGYGYSGWIWETAGENFILKQGPKLLSLETSFLPE
ncbi:MAG TPA: aldehyde dehydrogenase family protein [Desulfobaccales bacterium]|nr:aldehyde dehydrogenase family protein [Desulfobaccales bacterium]